MVKHKNSSKIDNLKAYRKRIPLELLTVTDIAINEESVGGPRSGAQAKKSIINRSTGTSKPSGRSTYLNGIVPHQANNRSAFSITFNHLVRKGYSMILWATTWQAHVKNGLKKLETHQTEICEQNTVFGMITLSEGFFDGSNKVTCCTF
ncbi:hypothetical protein O181_081852 [Austropuccinia psidii MF-1]|uniref:Pleckstrin homology domain-containing protein n=1 Tax=Austropuccinia psidii MF-1 TaxID=1389203 RepID=A0A9Q3FPD1_9BASI|nr:hypothetical protein [Austropuccinia psidii MF-1]